MKRLLSGLLLAVSLAAEVDPKALVGMVTRAEGDWSDRLSSTKVSAGHAVLWGSELVPNEQGKGRLLIRIFSTGRIEEFDCVKLNCGGPINFRSLVKPQDEPGTWALAFRAIAAIVHDTMSKEDERTRTLSGYARGFSGRGLGDIELTDSIVSPDDFSPVFAKVQPGSYLIDLCAIDDNGRSACGGPPKAFTVDWKGGKLTSANKFVPGVYEVFYCKKDEVRTTRVSSAWALIASDAPAAEKIRVQFDQFKQSIADWTPREISILTHAYLAALAKASR